MREIDAQLLTKNIKEMCIEANYELSADVKDKLYDQAQKEESILGKQILEQLKENLDIAHKDRIPICQLYCTQEPSAAAVMKEYIDKYLTI